MVRRILVLMGALAMACQPESKEKEGASDAPASDDGSKVVTSYYANKKIQAEITYKDGKKNGMSKSYDKDGNLMLELPYVDGKREGQSKRYYVGSILYQTTEYKDDKMHGTQTKYRSSGPIMSEARFEADFPCTGLKEYLEDGTLKKKYPKMIIRPVDQVDTYGIFLLEVSMSEKVKKVKFYTGKLTPGGCLSGSLNNVYLDEATKTGKITYDVPPGRFLMEEVSIIAAVETLQGNSYITQTTYNLAIDN